MWSCGLLALLLSISPLTLRAQTGTTGDVAGVVKDTTDAVIAGATVTLKSLDTGETRTATTNDAGGYRFTFLAPGSYTVSAQTAGLKTDTTKVAVQVGQATCGGPDR